MLFCSKETKQSCRVRERLFFRFLALVYGKCVSCLGSRYTMMSLEDIVGRVNLGRFWKWKNVALNIYRKWHKVLAKLQVLLFCAEKDSSCAVGYLQNG